MSTSEQINELATALAKAQGEIKNVVLNQENPFFKSKYADLAAVREATIPYLSKHDLSIVQYTETVAAGMLLHTRLMHSSGQWIDGDYPIATDVLKPQAVGSALTYARRYSWAGITGLAAEVDDDGNSAQDHSKTNGSHTRQAPPIDHELVCERLLNTMKQTKNYSDYYEWQRRNKDDFASLPLDKQKKIRKEREPLFATFPPMTNTEQAKEASKPPLPDDDIKYE